MNKNLFLCTRIFKNLFLEVFWPYLCRIDWKNRILKKRFINIKK